MVLVSPGVSCPQLIAGSSVVQAEFEKTPISTVEVALGLGEGVGEGVGFGAGVGVGEGLADVLVVAVYVA